MSQESRLKARSGGLCELCKAPDASNVYTVGPESVASADTDILICHKCVDQIEKKEPLDSKHWSVLTESMWSEVPAVQVMSWRMLNRLRQESWAADQLDMMYLDDATLAWAKASGDHENDASVELHRDCNGNILKEGDSVVLIKSLDVKGSTLNARMGTVVKNIRLVENNTEQIEGKIEGQVIVILTKYVRKQG
ncbi:PhnA domain-containing protein [Flavihumibacter rivuli]|uniref:PhnA domain-containing protein n=1 Tax=Flavihumibacter rivuli TaxID=2838156 RepID=UPI001BDEC917|nr:alkylphosphonate utilization protein [Flavihumibacter rivuli]ULQ57599.1 PhnA domain-containing protein [Flavihumibacter rivuli]